MIDPIKIRKSLEVVLEVPFQEGSSPENSAVLIYQGGNQEYRLAEGVKNWPGKGKHLWIAGTRGDPFLTRREVIEQIEKSLGEKIDPYYIKTQGWANNTLDQSRWATELLKKNEDVNHIVVATAAYHAPRSILTFLKTLMKQQVEGIVISPVPIYHPLEPSPNNKIFIGEMERVPKYQGTGDAATLEEWCNYLQWRSIKTLK